LHDSLNLPVQQKNCVESIFSNLDADFYLGPDDNTCTQVYMSMCHDVVCKHVFYYFFLVSSVYACMHSIYTYVYVHSGGGWRQDFAGAFRTFSALPNWSSRLAKLLLSATMAAIYMHTRVQCLYVFMYLCIYVSMYLCIYVSIFVCMYT